MYLHARDADEWAIFFCLNAIYREAKAIQYCFYHSMKQLPCMLKK